MASYRFRVIVNASRGYFFNAFRRRKERAVRDVLYCIRLAFMRPRRTLLLSATAAYKKAESGEPAPPCEQGISDQELEKIMTDLEAVEKLAQQTLYCTACGKRLVIDRKHSGIHYCMCKTPQTPDGADSEGWEPYMEAEDVVIWRKEYRKGQGLYAYKVYGRYNEVWARDFASIQVDGAYRRSWDSAVAALSVVEGEGSEGGDGGEAVLHWEVLWPRMFANRDYVYIRRHKEFNVNTPSRKEALFSTQQLTEVQEDSSNHWPNVHSRARRKAIQDEKKRLQAIDTPKKTNKAFIILSRSCVHSKVPETKNAVRVTEYWSHMCVRTLRGTDEPGMEFVLTYYDDPGVGTCGAMAAWATGRAAPAYLERMRRAASDYNSWKMRQGSDSKEATGAGPESRIEPAKVSTDDSKQDQSSKPDSHSVTTVDKTTNVNEKYETDNETEKVVEQTEKIVEQTEKNVKQTQNVVEGTQNVDEKSQQVSKETQVGEEKVVLDEHLQKDNVAIDKSTQTEVASERNDNEKNKEATSQTPEVASEPESNGSWWRYLYPFYYFI